MDKMDRRKFFGASALVGYTLAVKAPQTLAAGAETASKCVPFAAGRGLDGLEKNYMRMANEPLMGEEELSCDLLVAGGGLSGIAAAISAARHGKKVILVQDRSRLGGNASSEIKMHPLGVNPQKVGWREGGIIEELKLENAERNPQLSWEVWDFMLYDKCVSEPNIKLLLDTSVYGARTGGGKIKSVFARSESSRMNYKITAPMFIDATGDSRLALEAGASCMTGRETPETYGESLSGFDPQGTRQGSTLIFTSRLYDKPMPFKAPKWAKKIYPKDMKFRNITGDGLSYGYWWVELGGMYDAIKDTERLRFELLSIVMGVWDYIKNSGEYPAAANRAIESIGMIPGRRETFRIRGDYVMTQNDIEGGWRRFDDAIAVGGWSMDDHPAEGFYASDRPPCRQKGHVPFYNIPFSVLRCKDIDNLMMAGRNISCSHVAFTSTRVMSTCAAVGQAAGTAAALCLDFDCTPRELAADKSRLNLLQQTLLKDDQTILGIANSDPEDIARSAKISSSPSIDGSAPQNVISGVNLDKPGENKNRWVADAASKPWIKLEWDSPRTVSKVQIIFESGNTSLAQTNSDYLLKTMVRGPQPTIVKDFTLSAMSPDGSLKVISTVKDNYQKLVRLNFPPEKIKSLRLDISATNGSPKAIVKEIRAMA